MLKLVSESGCSVVASSGTKVSHSFLGGQKPMKNCLVSTILKSVIRYLFGCAVLVWVYVMVRAGYGAHVVDVLDAFARLVAFRLSQ
jgi:hypothetical protein